MKDIHIAKPVFRVNKKEPAREHIERVLQSKAGPLYAELKDRFEAMKVKDHMNVIFKFEDSFQTREIVVSSQEMAHFS